MTTHIAFLRGINVGAHNRMKMDDLREMCESLGLEHVQTYIQSGNVVFETPETDGRALGEKIADAIDDSFGYDIMVTIRTQAELANIVEQQPFDKSVDGNTNLYVTFLYGEPSDETVEGLLAVENEAEEFVVNGRTVYSRIDKNRLDNGRFTDTGKILDMSATRRNWNVVTKVHELAHD